VGVILKKNLLSCNNNIPTKQFVHIQNNLLLLSSECQYFDEMFKRSLLVSLFTLYPINQFILFTLLAENNKSCVIV